GITPPPPPSLNPTPESFTTINHVFCQRNVRQLKSLNRADRRDPTLLALDTRSADLSPSHIPLVTLRCRTVPRGFPSVYLQTAQVVIVEKLLHLFAARDREGKWCCKRHFMVMKVPIGGRCTDSGGNGACVGVWWREISVVVVVVVNKS
ncbi:hypothetical protein BaRGS_00022137, partial [Batillaria attramentaria]